MVVSPNKVKTGIRTKGAPQIRRPQADLRHEQPCPYLKRIGSSTSLKVYIITVAC